MKSLRNAALAGIFGPLVSFSASAVPVTFSATGADAPSIAGTVAAYRAALGGPNNGVTPGSQPNGFRDISWDGNGAGAAPAIFASTMTAFSNRGNVYTTPGTGFEISGLPSTEFGDINATYPGQFVAFSLPHLFAALGSNVMDVLFTVPGSTTAQALTRGFGAVFTDVDLGVTTSLEFFDRDNLSLGTFFAPTFDSGLSFLGVEFDDAVVSRVRITSGNSPFGPGDGDGTDIVALDNFIFGEPQAVPEPATLALLGLGIAGIRLTRRQARRAD